MKVVIAAVGRMKQGPERTLFESYTSRLPWSVEVRELDQNKSTPELEKITASVPSNGKMICLDSRGKSLSSEQFARRIQDWRDEGFNHVTFVIGGPDGLAKPIIEKADLTLSFGLTTWPHLLVRVMLAEQLYRAHSILSGHPYHSGH